jgi:hypothetical protein
MEPHDPLDEAIERWMRERPARQPPATFTATIMGRVRDERWQTERYWDIGFNITIAAGLVLIVAGVLGLVYLSGLSVVGRDAALLFAQGLATAADRIYPMLPAYAGGFVLTASALGLWWWAEN